MPKQPKEKSAHLKALETTFDHHTRRFSPFAVLGLSPDEPEENSPILPGKKPPTHTSVDSTHPHGPPTHEMESSTHPPVAQIHTRVVVVEGSNTTTTDIDQTTHMDVPPTHVGVGDTHPQDEQKQRFSFVNHPHRITEAGDAYLYQASGVSQTVQTGLPIYNVLAATQLRTQLGKKARQVVGYLNSLRSVERPTYTMPVGYAQISAFVDVHPHYLRRDVLPKLAMLGVIGIVHKSLHGTIYHLHYEDAFLRIVAGDDAENPAPVAPQLSLPEEPLPSQPLPPPTVMPSWVDQEHWGWLAPETIRQLVARAGSEEQAQEKLAIILYNETHGPVERRVRDRRAVLAHYLRTSQADIWPNDDGFETLAVQRARQERDRALQEKAFAEEALRVRQEAAKVRFLAALADTQMEWVRQEAKRRVDARPDAQFLTSRYPLYKAEEEQLISEWMDRGNYGEAVPHSRAT
jgi:hypothetical protein